MSWNNSYKLDDFQESDLPTLAGRQTAVVNIADPKPLRLEDLPNGIGETALLRQLAETGDDPGRPRSGPNPRHPSRSHSVYAAAHALARAGCDEAQIAGILLNPKYGISASVLDKRNPRAYALRQATRALQSLETGWADTDKAGRPRATMPNTLLALGRLDLSFAYDKFRYRKMVNGTVLQEFQGELSDDAVAMIRALILETFKFDPKAENVRDAVNQLCLESSFHPVREMLDGLSWDGVSRLDKWLTIYLGADDTELNAAIGPIVLIAAVRRIRQPGVKFDQIVILEGPQGSGKSSALRILAGDGLHSDQEILTQEARAQMELMEGIWIYELGEVEGFSRAEVNKIKAFASRQEDRSRMAYGRFVESRPRQAIFIGTTNETTYLRDQTGNRRFWPVRTGKIDLEMLQHDRDQLLAEASVREARGESIVLPQELWDAAAAEQAERLEDDPWLEVLATVRGVANGDTVRVETHHLLRKVLGVDLERQNQSHSKRLATLMRKLGWTPTKFRVSGTTLRGYERAKQDGHVDDDPDFPPGHDGPRF
ncbi:VapE domain-containing protein [Mesorhizobium marinum]|uniref:VapE domain-containing protein n=1 Tax=Mesorhizobium marinum TaxID=3228790 RepID=UPI00346669CC